jgi:outer membrane lipoprotein SlyB
VRGSVAAGVERGAASGGARGLVRGLLHETFRAKKPSKPYRAFVRRCLHDRGYDLIGWE